MFRFAISSEVEAKALKEASNVLFLDIWDFAADWADIRLAADVVPSLLGLLPSSLQNAHTPLMPSLASAILETYPISSFDSPALPGSPPFTHSVRPSKSSQSEKSSLFFRDYQPLTVIHPWLRLLSSLFPTHTRLLSIGLSYEGREIPALRLGVHPKNNDSPLPPRKTILITGGIHAREWISTSSVNYVAYSLLTSYGKSASITSLLEKFDFIFIPTLNPDGYAYTWNADRLWRKNRQQTSLRFCPGIDLDHSFPYQWDGGVDSPSGTNPCSENFAGEEPFEGHEARVLRTWMKNETESNHAEFVSFLDFHSYSQQVLYPYAYSCEATPRSLENLEELAMGIAKAIRVSNNGKEYYGVTSACEGSAMASAPFSRRDRYKSSSLSSSAHPRTMIESRGGSALDYMFHEMGIEYSYQIKLRDTGAYGFLLPRSNIVPTGEEALAAVKFVGWWLMGDRRIQCEGEGGSVVNMEGDEDVEERKKYAAVLRKMAIGGDDEDVYDDHSSDDDSNDGIGNDDVDEGSIAREEESGGEASLFNSFPGYKIEGEEMEAEEEEVYKDDQPIMDLRRRRRL